MSLVLELDDVVIFNNTDKPTSYRRMEKATFGIATITLFYSCSVLLLLFVRLTRSSVSPKKRRVLRFLVLATASSFGLSLIVALQYDFVADYSENFTACVWVVKFSAFYALFLWTVYMILLEREDAAREGLKNTRGNPEGFLKHFRYGIKVSIWFCLPFMVGITFLLGQGKIIFKERACYPHILPGVTVLGGVSGTLLSLSLLYLFAEPVIQISKLSSSEKGSELNKILLKNLFWSSLMIGSTCVTLFTYAVFLVRVDRSDDPDEQWKRLTGPLFTVVDACFNLTGILAIYPGAWIDDETPSCIRSCFIKVEEAEDDETYATTNVDASI
mmetsp:Transcript_8448/g.10123  ORF Transcript_8448/g.10123 Transcript_8448/m.10123 type:complete len:329 (-) Transcript_8448:450-1436(-)